MGDSADGQRRCTGGRRVLLWAREMPFSGTPVGGGASSGFCFWRVAPSLKGGPAVLALGGPACVCGRKGEGAAFLACKGPFFHLHSLSSAGPGGMLQEPGRAWGTAICLPLVQGEEEGHVPGPVGGCWCPGPKERPEAHFSGTVLACPQGPWQAMPGGGAEEGKSALTGLVPLQVLEEGWGQQPLH